MASPIVRAEPSSPCQPRPRFAAAAAMPSVYFQLMLKGHEWLAQPKLLPHMPGTHEMQAAGGYGPGQKKAA